MTAITQKIRRFTGGISDQPDEQKIPGQVRDAVNCVPDVVQGLIKRPGMNLINDLNTHKGGKWFFIDKANNFNNFDRYVGQIDNLTGKVKVWDLENGKLMDVCYTDNVDPLDIRSAPGGISYNVPEYASAYTCEGEPGEDPNEDYFTFNEPDVDDLQVLTINDYTFVVNRKVPVQMTRNEEEKRGPSATVELRSIAGLTEYRLDFTEPNPNESTTTALELSITSTGYNNNPPTCSSDLDQTFSNQSNGAGGTGLSFTIQTTSVVAPINPNDQNSGSQCVYTTKVILEEGGDGWAVGDTVTVLANGVTYVVRVERVGTTSETNPIGSGSVTSTTDRENPKADQVLDELVTDINDLDSSFTATRIGNSIFIERAPDANGNEQPFTVTTPNSILLRVISSTAVTDDNDNFVLQANDIDQVPLQTRHNTVFFIRNSFTDSDDYYVRFIGDNDTDGTGTYVETTKPGIDNTFLSDSMPHGLLRLSETRRDADNDIIVTFLVASFKWASREAGDDNTNPRPSFAPEQGATFGRPINNLAFFRNRFVTLSDENVICSVAGDFFNFWAKTATTVSPSDPIDLQVSNNFPAVLYNSQATTSGLVLFSENAQFMLGTENDVLEPRTARTTLLSTYNFNRNSNPVNLGTTVGFVSGIGRYTRFYEMANISRDREPEVVEQTKVVERLVPGDYYDIAISKDNSMVSMGKRESNEVWMFRYFNTGERRAQSAWTRWELHGEIVSHALINDSYFPVLYKDGRVYLCRGDIRALQSTTMLSDAEGEEYRTFIDYAVGVETTNSGKKIILDSTAIGFPIFDDIKENILSIVYDPTDEQGYIVPVTIDGTQLTIKTTVVDPKIFLGYTFNMKVDLPVIFVKKEGEGSVQSWDTANVIVQRVKLNFGRIGYFETTLKRSGREDYTQIYEARPMDRYSANELGYLPDYDQTTPIYQRNNTFRMSIHSQHPAPAVLYSATWEGQYQENYVKRL